MAVPVLPVLAVGMKQWVGRCWDEHVHKDQQAHPSYHSRISRLYTNPSHPFSGKGPQSGVSQNWTRIMVKISHEIDGYEDLADSQSSSS